MALIDKSYFLVKDRLIPNLSNTNVEAALNAFIEAKEPEFLKMLFGELLYADYAAGLLLVPVPAQWTDLQTAAIKQAFANYVYCEWIDDNQTHTTAEGEVRPTVENGTLVSPARKYRKAWNRIWPNVEPFAVDMDTKTTIYTNWRYGYKFFLYQAFRPINDFGI